MAQLENVPASDLRNAFDDVNNSTATKRLMVAIAYKQGVSQSELSEWYGFSQKTIYNWLQRFEEGSIQDAVYNNARPDRLPKHDRDEQVEVSQLLRKSPVNVGYEAEEWKVSLVHPARKRMVRYQVFTYECMLCIVEYSVIYFGNLAPPIFFGSQDTDNYQPSFDLGLAVKPIPPSANSSNTDIFLWGFSMLTTSSSTSNVEFSYEVRYYASTAKFSLEIRVANSLPDCSVPP